MRRLMALGTLLVAAAVAVPAAAIPSAMPIKYTISGTFSGSLGDETFSDVPLAFTGVGDTGTVFGGGTVTVVPVALTVTNPLGTGTLAVSDREAFGVNRGDGGYVFFENIDSAGNSLFNFPVVVSNAAFGAYSGLSVTGPTAAEFVLSTPAPTTGGALSLTAGTGITFSAAVPEPAAWGLMITGFAVVGIGQRGRRPGVVAA